MKMRCRDLKLLAQLYKVEKELNLFLCLRGAFYHKTVNLLPACLTHSLRSQFTQVYLDKLVPEVESGVSR